MNNNKLFFRQLFKKQRSELTDNQVKILNKRILKNLTTIKIWDNNFYHLYLSNDLNKEVETDKLIKLLLDKTRKNESKKYELLERKYLSAKGINVALERQLMFRNQQVELRKAKSSSSSSSSRITM